MVVQDRGGGPQPGRGHRHPCICLAAEKDAQVDSGEPFTNFCSLLEQYIIKWRERMSLTGVKT